MTVSLRCGPVSWWPSWSEGVHVDAVLGLSMTPTSLGLVVVGGDETDGDAAGRDAFSVPVGADIRQAADQVTAAVEAISAARGHRLKSIGLTWSDDAGDTASVLMESLTESGFANVVPVRLPEATEALARGMAEVLGYRTSAVCVIEPDTVIALVVHTGDGAVQTAINHGIDSDEALIGWLSAVFTRADWQPQALVVVGSAGDFGAVLPRLEEALSVPVFAPAEAPLALARGAALASTHSIDLPFDENDLLPGGVGRRGAGARRWTPAGALTGVLSVGAVTFVASASVAVAIALSPEAAVPPPRPVVAAAHIPAAPATEVPAALPAPVPEAAPVVPEAAVAPVEPAPEAPVALEAPETYADVSVVDAVPPADASTELPAMVPAPPLMAPDPAVAAAVPPPIIAAPVPVQAATPPTKKPLLERIRDRLRLGGGDDAAPPIILAPQG